MMASNRVVDAFRVVATVTGEAVEVVVDLAEEFRHLGCIANAALGELGSNDEAVGVHPDVELPPGSPRPRLVLPSVPLAVAEDLEPGAVHDEMDGAVVPPGGQRHVRVSVAAGKRRVTGRREVEAHQAQNRVQEALGLSERQVEDHSQGQGGHDREVSFGAAGLGLRLSGWRRRRPSLRSGDE